jgi:hypothetical protein
VLLRDQTEAVSAGSCRKVGEGLMLLG